MVKVRGYRIEPSGIEVMLQTHLFIHEVAVKVCGEGIHARLVDCIVPVGAYNAINMATIAQVADMILTNAFVG